MPDDVIDALVKQILAAAPGLSAEVARASAAKIRSDFGGARHYVKTAAAAVDDQAGATPARGRGSRERRK